MTYIMAQNLITKAVENKYRKRKPRERERESFFIKLEVSNLYTTSGNLYHISKKNNLY